MSRDWDVVVVGLGALGSAAAYWCSRRTGLRVLALERYEIGHTNGASEDVSRIIRRSYHRRDYVRLTARAYESWAEVERESASQVVFRTGWPGRRAARDRRGRGDRHRRVLAGDDRGGRPVRDARWARGHAPLAGVAPRRRARRAVPGRRRARRPVARQPRPPAAGDGPWRRAAGAGPGRANRGCRRRDDRGARGRRAPDGRQGHRRHRRLDQRPARAARREPPAHRDPGAGQLVHAGRRPLAVRPGPLPDLDLDGRALVLRLPDPRPPGPQDRPGRRRATGHARDADVRAATRRRWARVRRSSRRACPAWPASRS